ncbi:MULTISPECIES: glycosyltransferase [unclassified Methylobacterium]|jgi:Glycosyl transferases group 1|uniref:glycosyltransferase n=1 Tax=unclassified Methylobacterium TaxID=2615210 RepID=UPI001355A627|nr:glycosyltransferase [Methylobacterium sp. 2A]MWV22007.1 glycosyltransferase [Methylobacterium sp. 2A]
MIRFCYVGHSFHHQTKSTIFIKEILSRLGIVTEFSSSPDDAAGADDKLLRTLANSDFDCYVFLQTEYIAKKLAGLNLGRFVIIPMYDGAVGRPNDYWKGFVNTQFISFSRAHHELLQSINCKTAYFRYFPEQTTEFRDLPGTAKRDAFFWERRPDKKLNLSLVLDICRVLKITSLHVHRAHDFADAGPYQFTDLGQAGELELTSSVWFDDKAALTDVSSRPSFYFAPRLREGIGMSFLEAMGRGQIVVAPDLPTMSEYICHGITGVLYNPDDPQINFSLSDEEIASMRHVILQKAMDLRSEWVKDVTRLESLLLGDNRRWPTRDYSSHFAAEIRKAASLRIA